MKTVLYNTQTQKVKQHAKQGYYKVRGKRPTIPAPWVELVVENTQRPSFNASTHRISSEWVVDIPNEEYRRVWTLTALTQYEIDIRAWVHTDYAHCLVIKKSFLAEDAANHFHWWRILEYPIEKRGNKIVVWYNDQNEANLGGLGPFIQDGTISIQNRPENN